MERKYFGVHNHTMYSNLRLLDSTIHSKDLIKKAIELGLSGIAITDHECLSAHAEVNQIAEELQKTNPDFTIALGNEIYLVDERKKNQKYFHFILIAKDAIGHKALRELSSIAWNYLYTDKGFERVPITKQELSEVVNKYKGHLIATSACRGGELSTLSLDMVMAQKKEDVEKASYAIIKLMNLLISVKNYLEKIFILSALLLQIKNR